MSKKVVRKAKVEKKEAPVAAKQQKPVSISYSLTQLYYDIDTVKMLIGDYTDAVLFDYCSDQITQSQNRQLDRLYNKISAGGKLEKAERESLEAFCILANTELCLSV